MLALRRLILACLLLGGLALAAAPVSAAPGATASTVVSRNSNPPYGNSYVQYSYPCHYLLNSSHTDKIGRQYSWNGSYYYLTSSWTIHNTGWPCGLA